MCLAGRRIIVTGGPTREWIDPVRYISNASSGKMGVALADAAWEKSRDTVFIHGPMERALLAERPYRMIAVEGTADLLRAVLDELAPESVLIMAAAPADYAPAARSGVKIKKAEEEFTLRLRRNPDILKTIAAKKAGDTRLAGMFLVGFAAETHDIEEYALGKLRDKDLDMICLNDVGRRDAGFAADTNLVTVYTRAGEKEEYPLLPKSDLAARIIGRIEAELTKRGY
jgi:phosphopantothenoylcysteine synthetase/decarboxylase